MLYMAATMKTIYITADKIRPFSVSKVRLIPPETEESAETQPSFSSGGTLTEESTSAPNLPWISG